jgi:hypothetical protein
MDSRNKRCVSACRCVRHHGVVTQVVGTSNIKSGDNIKLSAGTTWERGDEPVDTAEFYKVVDVSDYEANGRVWTRVEVEGGRWFLLDPREHVFRR